MKKVMFISSEGGHLDELRQLNIENYDYSIVTEKTPSTINLGEKYNNVSFLMYGTRKNPLKYLWVMTFNFFKSMRIFLKYKPDVVVTTGTHTAVLMCYIARLFRKKVIWIETFANRNTKTLAGRLVYPIANTFVIQWEEMQKLYPRAKFWGSIY